ncbi:MraY family glycosyltransferase [Azohydromonas sediminis]|uniref:MraY family glycosyltransferase n=1 Tax=Azohydromonas sediminis TaxID=2259674 RepID=UPI000E650493|nr:MraY family glycosyltransferase [Azohydromonas sediminis]
MLFTFFSCSLVSLAVIFLLRPLATRLGLVDVPGGRKRHDGHVPLIGGVGIFAALLIGVGLAPGEDRAPWLMAACGLLVAVGVVDDRFDVRARVRLVVHLAAAAVAVWLVDANDALTLGRAFGTPQPLTLFGTWAMAVGIVLVGGVINAFNMADGMDGLAGTLAMVAFMSMGVLAAAAADGTLLQVCIAMCGAISGFLAINFPLRRTRRWRVFLGDAGSTLLGFVAAYVGFGLSQGADARVAPVTVLWLAAVPVADLLITMSRRALQKRSPFRPDRGHFHHQLLDAGLTPPAALGLMTTVAVALAAAGLGMHWQRVSETTQLVGFFATTAAMAWAAARAPRWVHWTPVAWRRDTLVMTSPSP